MAGLLSVLGEDHEKVKNVLAGLLKSGSGEAAERNRLVKDLVMLESGHEAAEEMYLWPLVRQRVRAGNQLATEALRQERQGKTALAQLRGLRPEDGRWEELVAAFADIGSKHIAYEEGAVWPELTGLLSPAESDKLGAKVVLAKRIGPTRPHFLAPQRAVALKTMGLAVSLLDHAADAVTRRSRPGG